VRSWEVTAVGRFQLPDRAWAQERLAPLIAWGAGAWKMRGHKAAGASGTRLVPALRYRNVDHAIDWLCAAFGFEQRDVVAGTDGGILYAHLTHGSVMVLVRSIGESELDRLMKQPDEIGGAETQSCYLVVEDADAHCQQARAAGAEILLEVAEDDHGGRGYSCRDPEGHMWSFGTYDPWQGQAVSPSARLPFAVPGRVVALSAMLVCLVGGATAGWMLPRVKGDEALLKEEASTARARAEKAEARANQLADELARQATARNAAELAARGAREQIEQKQGAKQAMETTVRELENRVAEQRRASDAAAQAARAELAKEQAVGKEAQRVTLQIQQELAREREAKQRAENSLRSANERLAQERQARLAAERAASEGKKKVTKTSKESVPDKAKEAPSATVGGVEFPIFQP
jgi:uncharacterized glyoxalase superfamily protein PhnB